MVDIFLSYDADYNLIIARYLYHKDLPRLMEMVLGVKYKAKGKLPDPDEGYYRIKATWDNALALRRVFKDGCHLDKSIKDWGRKEKKASGMLRKLSNAEEAELEILPEVMPELYKLITTGRTVTLKGENKPRLEDAAKPRPFQTADIAFAAARHHSMNLNHPGLGKTIEVIGAIGESGLLWGSHLIICPLVSKETVWQHEWESWVDKDEVPIIVTPEGRGPREEAIQLAIEKYNNGEPFALVVNPAMAKMKSEFEPCDLHKGDMCKKCGESQGEQHMAGTGHRFVRGKRASVHTMRTCELGKCVEKKVPAYPELHQMEWDWVVMDEIQKMGVYDTGSDTYKGLNSLRKRASATVQMSGTPFGGKAINVYHLLHLMDPKEFSNKADWANRWLNVQQDQNFHAKKASQGRAVTIGELKSCHRHPELRSDEDNDCELCNEIRQPFWDMMSTHCVRRTKAEYLSELPDKQRFDIWVDMTPAQARQYEEFDRNAEVTIDEYDLGAVGALAVYARLKQFAGAVQNVEVLEEATLEHPMRYKLTPTEDSPKLPQIMRIMEELGIVDNDPVGGEYEQLVIYSESKAMVDMVHAWLVKNKIPAEKLTGDTPNKERSDIQRRFQAEGGTKVLAVSTLAAGVSINLDRASNVIFLDETWNPDDQEQAEDRCHRGSRIHQVRVMFIRTKGTVQEDIRQHVSLKSGVNTMLLGLRKNKKK